MEVFNDQKYDKLNKHHTDLGVPWRDPSFPTSDASIGISKLNSLPRNIQWKRPKVSHPWIIFLKDLSHRNILCLHTGYREGATALLGWDIGQGCHTRPTGWVWFDTCELCLPFDRTNSCNAMSLIIFVDHWLITHYAVTTKGIVGKLTLRGQAVNRSFDIK